MRRNLGPSIVAAAAVLVASRVTTLPARGAPIPLSVADTSRPHVTSRIAADSAQPAPPQGWNIARDAGLVPGNGNYRGYVMDGYGGAHPFHPTGDGITMPAAITTAYWGGWDIAVSVWGA